MRSLAAMGGKNAFSSNHASKIVGSSFPTNQNGLAIFLSSLYGIVSGEYSFTNSSTRRSVEALGNYIVVSLGIELRMQQLIKLLGVYALYSFFLGDKAFLLHLDCDVQSCSSSTLTNTGLKHPKLALFNGELDVAHIAEMVFEDGEYLFELTTSLFKARSFLELCNGAGVTDTGNNVFALCVNKVVAVEFLFAICGVTRKSNARSGGVTLVAENHGLNVYGSTQIIGDLVLLAVENSARIVPAAKYRFNSKLKLDIRALGELNRTIHNQRRILRGIYVLREDLLELSNKFLKILSGKVSISLNTARTLHQVNRVLEQIAIKTHNNVGEHLDKTTIRVPCKTGVLGLLDQAIDGLIVKAEVQYGVHHARHGHRSAGANRNEQRIFCVADFLANALFKVEAVFLDGVQNAFGPGIVGVCILHASLAGNRESRRYRQPDVSHLSKVSALAAKDGLHIGIALGDVVALGVLAESVHTLDFCSHFLTPNVRSSENGT